MKFFIWLFAIILGLLSMLFSENTRCLWARKELFTMCFMTSVDVVLFSTLKGLRGCVIEKVGDRIDLALTGEKTVCCVGS